VDCEGRLSGRGFGSTSAEKLIYFSMRPGFPFFLELFKTTFLKQPRRMGKTLYELVFLASADFLQPIWNASLAFLGLSAALLLIDMMAIYRKKKKEGNIPVDFSKFEELQKRFGEMELRGMFMASVAFLLSIEVRSKGAIQNSFGPSPKKRSM
jgi:hypothetical protein